MIALVVFFLTKTHVSSYSCFFPSLKHVVGLSLGNLESQCSCLLQNSLKITNSIYFESLKSKFKMHIFSHFVTVIFHEQFDDYFPLFTFL